MKKNNIKRPRPLTGIKVSLDYKQRQARDEETIQENNDRLIKKFMKKVRKSEIIKEFLDRRYHVKPSQKKHRHNRHLKFVQKKVAEEEHRMLFSQKE